MDPMTLEVLILMWMPIMCGMVGLEMSHLHCYMKLGIR